MVNLIAKIICRKKQLDEKELWDKEKLQLQSEYKGQIAVLNDENRQQVEANNALVNQLQEKEVQLLKLTEEKKKLEQQSKIIAKKSKDKGFNILNGFKVIPPLLDKVIGRPFLLTVAEEFNYQEAEDKTALNDFNVRLSKTEKNFHCFRDEVKKDYSFRVGHFYSSREYAINMPDGRITMNQIMYPSVLKAGVEISSQYNSAIYQALHTKTICCTVMPEQVFGSPLLSYSFPIFDDENVLIGAISFSNDISQIVNIAKSLGSIVNSDSDNKISHLANILKAELERSKRLSLHISEEASMAQKVSQAILSKGKEIISSADRLKVLALNTAIEATKVGVNGRGVGIIAEQMRYISESTRKIVEEIYKNTYLLNQSSQKVQDSSSELEGSSRKLENESAVLFHTSTKITTQKDELATLVRMSIDEIAQNQDDLNKIFTLLK
jgi:hypothetical protein